MLKRKYGNRAGWKRVISKDYVHTFLDTKEYRGYVSLLNIHKVVAPSFVEYDGKQVCIVDDGYIWLQHFPSDRRYSVTTMFNANGKIVQWYIDICRANGVEDGVPWMDDLFLDIVVLPTGEIYLKDVDELEEALEKGSIDQNLYDIARAEANCLNEWIKNNQFGLLKLSEEHKDLLIKEMTLSKWCFH